MGYQMTGNVHNQKVIGKLEHNIIHFTACTNRKLKHTIVIFGGWRNYFASYSYLPI